MPSIKKFLPWSKKKAHGSNFHEFHGYDNLRHTTYSPTSPALGGHHHPHLQQQYQQYTHPHHQTQPPPHSLAHKQHLNQQQVFMQSRQAPAYVNQQQQPLLQSQQQVVTYQHQSQPQMQQQQQSALAPHCQQCSIVHVPSQHSLQPQNSIAPNATTMVPPNVSHMHLGMPNQNFGHQQQRLMPPQSMISPTSNQHHQHPQQPQNLAAIQSMNADQTVCQHQNHQQQQQTNCQCHDLVQNYVNHNQHQANGMPHYQPTPTQNAVTSPHCVCVHHCVNNQNNHENNHIMMNGQQISEISHETANNFLCQHQVMDNAQLQQNLLSSQAPSHNKSTVLPALMPSPVALAPTTPNYNQQHAQHSQLVNPHQMTQQVLTQHQHQQQSDPIVNIQQHQHQDFHTLQPTQYQQNKLYLLHQDQITQQQQQQQHQHQHNHCAQQQHISNMLHQSMQVEQISQPQMQVSYQNQQPTNKFEMSEVLHESTLNESSRYANIPLRCDSVKSSPQKTATTTCSSQSTKFEDHVYCNQSQKFTLPPYSPPPDYETFVRNRRMYSTNDTNNGQHMTYHSESIVLDRTNNSGYENLKGTPPYGNFVFGRQGPGYTS